MHDIEESGVSGMVGSLRVAHLTILSSFDNSFNKLISRIEVLGTPSSSASSRIFLSATKLPVVRSLAL